MSTDYRGDAAPHASTGSPVSGPRIRHAVSEDGLQAFVLDIGDVMPVGRFHYAAPLHNGTQVLTTWRVSSDDPFVLGRIAEQFGGTSHRQDIHGNTGDVITETAGADIVLRGPSAVWVRWRRDSRSCCDGRQVMRHRGKPEACKCPSSLPERRAATRHGYGREPQVEVLFGLTENPTLGIFMFASGNWRLAEDAIQVIEALERSSGPVRARLYLHRTQSTLASGRVISYTRPRLTIHTPAEP